MKKVERLLAQFAAGDMPAITADDAAAITDTLHADMDRGVVAREAAVKQLGHTIACARGCNDCCAQVVVTAEAEAVTVARWLGRNRGPRERFLARVATWREAPIVDEVIAAAARDDVEALRELATAAMKAHLMCPFNHEGACDIYPVRPNLCRKVHALDSAEPCKTGGEALAADFTPIDDFLARARVLEDAMAEVLHAQVRAPLAIRVRALLERR